MTSAIYSAAAQRVGSNPSGWSADFSSGSLNTGGTGGGMGINPYTKIIGSAIEDAGKWEEDIGSALYRDALAKAYRNAYQNYLNYSNDVANRMAGQLTARAEKYDTKLQDQFAQAEPEYQSEANTPLAELEQLKNDIAQESTEAQRQNRRQVNANLAMQGVRGGQAAILANRATGDLNRQMQRDINQNAYNEALNRQNSRLNYYSQKALTPWSNMSSAYANSMVGANNALSNAQGHVYANAYNTALNNYLGSQNFNGKGAKRYLGGWMQLSGQHAQNAGQKMQQM